MVVLRLSAFIVLCIGVQIAWNGVKALVEELPVCAGSQRRGGPAPAARPRGPRRDAWIARHFLEGVFLVFAALLPIVNPLGAAPVFLAMTRYADEATRAVLARKVTVNSFVLLMASVFIGTYVLEFFGLSIPVVQVGGGLVVCSVAWDLLRGADVSKKTSAEDVHDPEAVATEAFYPLTLPLTVGPGSISVAITIGANHPQTVRSFVAAALSSLLGVDPDLHHRLSLLSLCAAAVEIPGRRRHGRRRAAVRIHPAVHRRADHVERHRRAARDQPGRRTFRRRNAALGSGRVRRL